ncbi:hypothetical protein [Brevibacterium ihuae]|uniref:hypothetical protein n=1 Tax=Brevibacterium ihuae TaxID=1631743 RepID=UPI001FE62902|nr:hypothetical protein [Brevibacterium ihuae]
MTAHDTVRTIMRGIIVRGLLITLVIAVLATAVGYFVAGMPGVWGALIGAATAFVFFAITAVLMLLTADSSPVVMAGAVLGGFLLKVAGLIALTASLRNLDFYDPWVLFVTLAVAAFASLIVDVVTVQRARLPIIDPQPGSPRR